MSDDQLRAELVSIQSKLDSLVDDTKMIRRAVFGEKITDNTGLIKRVHSLEKHKDRVEKAAVYGGGVLAVFMMFWDEIKKRIFGS